MDASERTWASIYCECAARLATCSSAPMHDGVVLPTPTEPLARAGAPSVLFPNGVSVAIRAKASVPGRHEKQQPDEKKKKTPSHVNQPPPHPSPSMWLSYCRAPARVTPR
ncbi:hypothetical protein MTO96_017462 [Rhipicephalus appendiculatus]